MRQFLMSFTVNNDKGLLITVLILRKRVVRIQHIAIECSGFLIKMQYDSIVTQPCFKVI